MGLISPPVQYTLMQKIPSFAMIMYTFNTLAFSAGLMDSMLKQMMGTTDEALPIVTSPQVDAMFVGFGLCNAVIAALIYPQSFSSTETVKFQQTVAGIFMFGFFGVMYFFFQSGVMGVSGAVQYGIMNGVLGCIAFYNAKSL